MAAYGEVFMATVSGVSPHGYRAPRERVAEGPANI